MAYEMSEEEQNRMLKYFSGGEIVCDVCGEVIDVNGSIWDRVITKDPEGFDVVERYFTCPKCKKHYTVSVLDRQQMLNIQKRRNIRQKIRLHIQIKSNPQTIQYYQRKEEQIREKQMQRSEMLKVKYREECKNGND